MKKIILSLALVGGLILAYSQSRFLDLVSAPSPPRLQIASPSPSPFASPPASKVLSGGTHTFQTFNNCGPSSLSMALSYYGINISQHVIGQALRPWQNSQGDNDDKSVTLSELAAHSRKFDLTPVHRPAGDLDQVRQLIALDLPVIARTWTKPDEDIGHFRVIKGYDQTSILQDDSLQGKDLWFTDQDFNILWKKFNYEYLVLVPEDKLAAVERILGAHYDARIAWSAAADISRREIQANPNDTFAHFNLSVALYNLGDYQGSVREFELVKNMLPARTLWYQIEPILSYYQLGQYDQVFAITSSILEGGNRAFSELYLLRGNILAKQGDQEGARGQYQLALKYNENLRSAKEAVNSLP